MATTKSRLTYIESKRLSISFSVLIIKCDSIISRFGPVDDFAVKYDLWGITNGELLMMAEMSDPPWELYEIADTILIPNGMVNKQDYLFAYEPLMIGVGYKIAPMFGQPIPNCSDIPWLGSMIYCFEDFHAIFVWLETPVQSLGAAEENQSKVRRSIDDEFPYLIDELRTMMKKDPLVRLMRDLNVPLTQKSVLSELRIGFDNDKINDLINGPYWKREWLPLIPKD